MSEAILEYRDDNYQPPMDNSCAVCGLRPVTLVVQSRNGAYTIGVCSMECMNAEPEIDYNDYDYEGMDE